MALTACTDVTPARWLESSEVPWHRLIGFGPAGFAAYARLRFLSDPSYEGQEEVDAEVFHGEAEQLRTLFAVLATHTGTPHECYFCLWEGSGGIVEPGVSVPRVDIDPVTYRDDIGAGAYRDPDAQPGVVPEHTRPPSLPGPRVNVWNRSYFLFHGPLSDADEWTTPEGWPAQPGLDIAGVAFAWPADHAWCVANDVDPHWAGIGGDAAVIDRLIADSRLDVVPADPAARQPEYR